MKNLMSTVALSLALFGASSAAFAESHLEILRVTCAEFSAMDLAGQEAMLIELTAAVDDADNDEITNGDVEVLCNGFEDSTVAQLLDGDA